MAVFSDHIAAIYNTAFSPDGRFFATGGGDGELNVYDVKVRKHVVVKYLRPTHRSSSYRKEKEYGLGTATQINVASLKLTGRALRALVG